MKDYEWQLLFPEIWGTLAIFQALEKKILSDRHRMLKQRGKQTPPVTEKS